MTDHVIGASGPPFEIETWHIHRAKLRLYRLDQWGQISHVPSGQFAWLGLRETTMRPVFQSVLAAAFWVTASVANAGPFEDGQAAYDRHDCPTAPGA